VIRISQQDNAAGAKRYYATADYYSEGQELVGLWGGKGASRLGLSGTVDKDSFERLCDNLHPQTGGPLTVRTRTERRVGYDFTFSVPKSVSLLYALSGDEGILDAFRGAVSETMRDMEAEMKTRIRKDFQDTDRTTGNMVWAEFIHTTSRPVDGIPDPQLHAHCFVFNTTWDQEEERWKAGQFAEIKRDTPYFQAAFRVRLANNLQDIGFGVERKRDDFEIAGISADVVKRFSRRTSVIEEAYKEYLAERLAKLGHGVLREGKLEVDGVEMSDKQILSNAERLGITNARIKAELGAETREQKGKSLSWDMLRKEWNSRLSDSESDALATVHRRERKAERTERGETKSVDHAIAHSYVREAVLPERKLLTEALKRGIGAVTVEGVTREMQNRPLIRSEVDGRKMATTKEMVALESKLIEFASKGRGRCRPLGDPTRPCSREWFNDGQKAAVRHALGSRDRVMIVRGVAGTGKTTLEQEIGEALTEAGKPVVAIAQSVKASREVLREEAGFANADTVAQFLKDERMQQSAKGGVILLDEASQLGTRDMLKVFEVAERQNARVLLVGDHRQHRSVTAGEPLRLLEEKAGLKSAEVTEILRQQGNYKRAAKALSEGRTDDAWEELDKLGWIKQVEGAERDKQLAAAYIAAVAEKKRDGEHKSALVVSPTHAEANRITDAIRNSLKAEGRIAKERVVKAWVPAHLTDAQKADPTQYDSGDLIQFQQNATGYQKGSRLVVSDGIKPPVELANRFEAYRPVDLALGVGDRVRVTAGGKTKDGKHKLSNGSLLTVEGFTQRGDLIVDHGWVIDRDWGHLAHGYVVTSHASQGVTVDKVFIGISSESLPATNQRAAYVAITRGREMAQIFTDDREELFKAMSRPDSPQSATSLAESAKQKPDLRDRRTKSTAQQLAAVARHHREMQQGNTSHSTPNREMDHDR
jgi:conjugative relaxase-like TrwC/TraI family protein